MLSLLIDPHQKERIKAARQRVDHARPGAIEALNALLQNPSAPAEAYEAVAAAYPLQFTGGMTPSSTEQHNKAIALLKKKNDKAVLTIRTGAEISYENPPRLSTGCLQLDWVLGGGPARGYIGQFKGADSNGKTFVALKTAAEVLLRGGRVLWVAAERFDKEWARKCGVAIPYGDEELAAASPQAGETTEVLAEKQARVSYMLAYNAMYPQGHNFDLSTGRNGNELLQLVADAIELNAWDLIVVDSIAVLRREKVLDDKNVGDETMGGEAKMINDFCARAEASFNAVESKRGRVLGEVFSCQCGARVPAKKDHTHCPTGVKAKWVSTLQDIGEPVRTAVIVINQIRDKGIGSPFTMKPDAGGGWGLRHGKGYDLEFHASEPLTVAVDGRVVPYGKRVQVETTKSKICPPFRKAVFEMAYATIPGFSEAAQYNPLVDLIGCKWKDDLKLVGLGELCGVVKFESPHYYIGGQRFHGYPKFKEFLENPANAHVVQAARAAIINWIQAGGV